MELIAKAKRKRVKTIEMTTEAIKKKRENEKWIVVWGEIQFG